MKISPSLLSCDFKNIEKEIVKLQKSGADMLHLDIMDGVFVPNITFGPCLIKSIRDVTDIPFDVHLMITEPHRYIEDFAMCGTDIITFHAEANSDIIKTINKIKSYGKKAGVSIKPKTDINIILPYLKYIDVVLVMTVEPGFGGQEFMPEQMSKVDALKDEIKRQKLNCQIEIDGGVNLQTINVIKNHPVDICVSGTCVFKSENMAKTIKVLKGDSV